VDNPAGYKGGHGVAARTRTKGHQECGGRTSPTTQSPNTCSTVSPSGASDGVITEGALRSPPPCVREKTSAVSSTATGGARQWVSYLPAGPTPVGQQTLRVSDRLFYLQANAYRTCVGELCADRKEDWRRCLILAGLNNGVMAVMVDEIDPSGRSSAATTCKRRGGRVMVALVS
jgi:hypothetical protein